MKERIIRFCESECISQSAFLSSCGLNGATLSTFGVGIRSDKLAKIALAYPKLNMRWLLTGQGEMLSQEYSGASAVVESVDWYREQLNKKDEQIATLSRHIDFLMKLLEKGDGAKTVSQSINL